MTEPTTTTKSKTTTPSQRTKARTATTESPLTRAAHYTNKSKRPRRSTRAHLGITIRGSGPALGRPPRETITEARRRASLPTIARSSGC